MFDPIYINRTLCEVLEEMRSCCKTGNYSYLPGLIEEAQSMGNRMEASLGDKKDIERRQSISDDLKEEIKELRAEKIELGNQEIIKDANLVKAFNDHIALHTNNSTFDELLDEYKTKK